MTDRARTTGSATTTTASAAGNRRRSPWAVFVRRLVREKPLGLVGAVIIALFVLVSVFADILAPDPEQRQDVTRSLQAPSARHLLGTDHTGRDFLSRNIYGARLSLLVGFAATAVAVAGGHRRSAVCRGSSAAGSTCCCSGSSMPGWPFRDFSCS